MGGKEKKQPLPKRKNRNQSSDSDEESNETMPILALNNLSLDERAHSNETVAPEQPKKNQFFPQNKSKAIKKRGGYHDQDNKEKLKQKIKILNKKISQLEEELKIVKKQQDACPHCHFYLNQPSSTQRIMIPEDNMINDCFKRTTSRDSLQFQKMDFAAPLMYNLEMEQRSWIFLGTILIAMGSKVMDIDGTVNVFKIVKQSVDRIRRQVEKSQQKLSMDFFLSKEQLQGEHRMDQINFDPFYNKEEYRGGLQLESVRVESVQQYDLYFDQRLTFNVKYDALITIMEYMKENSNITFT